MRLDLTGRMHVSDLSDIAQLGMDIVARSPQVRELRLVSCADGISELILRRETTILERNTEEE